MVKPRLFDYRKCPYKISKQFYVSASKELAANSWTQSGFDWLTDASAQRGTR